MVLYKQDASVMHNAYFLHNFLLVFLVTCVVLNAPGSNAQSQDSATNDTPCQTPEGPGICKSIVACPTMLALLRMNPMPPDVGDRLRDAQCGIENGRPKVCCSVGTPNEPTATPIALQPRSLLPDTSKCGLDSGVKIYGGNVTEIDDFPWMALLEKSEEGREKYYCGGFLISSRYILTAAHCVNEIGDPLTHRPISVRLGEWNIDSDLDCVDGLCSDPVVDVPVEKRIIHENYNRGERNKYHDIALLRLARKVSYTNWIKPICLPIFNQRLLDTSYIDDDMHVSGWGRTETGFHSQLKLQVRLPIVNQSFCQTAYQRASLGVGQICAGGAPGKDSCVGDSGGPIMFNDVHRGNANWYAYGIVSFGPSKCATQGWPGVYTKIGAYGNWIMANIEP